MPIVVHGLVETQRAFLATDRSLNVELRDGLRRAAEPVRADAQNLAVVSIRNMTLPWSQMRVGVKADSVYVAPVKKGTRNPRRARPRFADLMMNRAMIPALVRNEEKVARERTKVVDEMLTRWERF